MQHALRRLGAFIAVVIIASLTVFAAPAAALTATSTSPADGASVQPGVEASDVPVSAVYDAALNPTTSTITLLDPVGDAVQGTRSFDTTTLLNDTIVFTPTGATPLADGEYTAMVHAVNAILPTDETDTTFSFTVDGVEPAQPTITSSPAKINATTQTAVTIGGGEAEEGANVIVSIDDENVGTAAVTSTVAVAENGTYSAQLDVSSLDDGNIDITASVIDAAGNASDEATADATMDTVAPAAPTVDFIDDPVDLTNQASVTISGTTAEGLGATVNISVDDANHPDTDPVTAAPTTAEDGSFTVEMVLTPLAQGTLTATATVRDLHLNTGNAATTTVLKDLGPPIFETSVPAGDARVQSAPNVSAEYNEPLKTSTSTITVKNKLGTTVAGTTSFAEVNHVIRFTPTGSFSETGSPYTVTLAVEDAEGAAEAEPTSFQFWIDTTAPATPTVDITPDPINAANKSSVTVSGTAEALSDVDVVLSDAGDGEITGTTLATAQGTWSVQLDSTTLDDGTVTATATSTDAAGNTSGEGTATATKDTVAPAKPVITEVTDPVTAANAETMEISGTAEAGASVEVTVEDDLEATVTGSATATGGEWTVTVDASALDYGALTVTAVATDAAGNDSAGADPETAEKIATNVTFTQSTLTPMSLTATPVKGNFDADGDTDILWYGAGTNPDRLWRSNGNGTYTSTAISVSGTYRPVAGDFDDDGDTDIFWYGVGANPDNMWRSNGDGTFTRVAGPTVKGTYVPIAGDFDADGDTDILWYAPGTGTDTVWRSNGNFTFTKVAQPTITYTYTPATGDFDGDGDTDIVLYGPGSGADKLWTSKGNFTFASTNLNEPATYIPVVGDFNGDGRDDYFRYVPGSGADTMVIQLVGTRTYNIGGSYVPVAGDHDDDGDDDIVWYAPGTGADLLWRANPS